MNFKKTVAEKIVNLGTKSAVKSTSAACMFFLYEPKAPKALQKMKKNNK